MLYLSRMKKFLFLACWAFAWGNASAQNKEQPELNLISDRTGQHTSAYLVPQGTWQFESGLFYQKQNTLYRKTTELQLPAAALRYGVLNRLEIRFRAQVQQNRVSYKGTLNQNYASDYSETGLNNIRVGVKFKLLKTKVKNDAMALQLETRLPLQSQPFRTSIPEPELRLALNQRISDSFSFLFNLGADVKEMGGDNQILTPNPLYSAALQYSNNHLFIFSEVFGQGYLEGPYAHCFNFGLAYNVTNNLQIDASGGLPLNEDAPDLLLSAGLSFRFKKN